MSPAGGFLSAGVTLVELRCGSVRVPEETAVRTLAVTQNITVDGSVEMLDDWFNPQGQADIDNSDLLEELHRQDSGADAFLVGRRTFEDLRGYWPGRSSPKTPPASPITPTGSRNTLSPRPSPTRSRRTPPSSAVIRWGRSPR
jgi:hypothetical protein